MTYEDYDMYYALLSVCVRSEKGTDCPLYLKKVSGVSLPVLALSCAQIFQNKMSDVHTDICINTDDDSLIYTLAELFPGISVIKRDSRLNDESVPKEDVYRDCVLKMEEKLGKIYDFLIDLDVTAPFRSAEDISGAVKRYLLENGTDVVMSAVRSRRNPYYNMAQINKAGRAERVIRSEFTAFDQAPICYEINASIYVVSREFLIHRMTFDLWQGRVVLYEMNDTGILRVGPDTDYELLDHVSNYCLDNLPGYKQVVEYAAEVTGIRPRSC